jgi:glycosyltransferase involved in cell wall biosynthesis
MRVVIAGDYPENPPNLVGGIQAIIYNTLRPLLAYDDLELAVVTCEKWRDRPLRRPRVVQDGRLTIHYLPSSPHIPHSLSMLTADRWAIHRCLAALAPDVIHAHSQVAAYPFAAYDTGRPTVVTIQGINTLEAKLDRRGGALKGGLRVALWGATERRCLQRATDLIVPSPFARQAVQPYTHARLYAIENPVHEDFLALPRATVPGRVLMVGSIQKRKGTLEAIRAMALVRRQVPQAELIIAGSFLPPYRAYGEQVRRAVTESDAADYVHLVGHLGHEALLEAHRHSQVFLFPTYLEGSPVALAEAMASGLPSVVTDIDSTAHLIEDGVTGYRVPPGDVEALADRLVRLLKDRTVCVHLGQAARQVAQARFSPERAARKTYELYQQLANRGSRQG